MSMLIIRGTLYPALTGFGLALGIVLGWHIYTAVRLTVTRGAMGAIALAWPGVMFLTTGVLLIGYGGFLLYRSY